MKFTDSEVEFFPTMSFVLQEITDRFVVGPDVYGFVCIVECHENRKELRSVTRLAPTWDRVVF